MVDLTIVDRAIAQAKAWSRAARKYPHPRAAELLAEALHHPEGLDYTVAFVDGVIRPEDPRVSAENLKELSKRDVDFLPRYLALPAVLGGRVAPAVPQLAMSTAEKLFARLVGDLILDVTPQNLGPAIASLRADGSRLNLNLLGEAVLGDEEAHRRMDATRRLVARDDVDYVSLKVSSVIAPHASFGYREAVNHAVSVLLPLFELARDTGTFLNLDMEEYKDLNLTIDVFKRLLGRDELLQYHAGIVLQAYVPDAVERLRDLTVWAKERCARGGAPIKIRVVKGANLSMESVDAELHGWALATVASKEVADANYLKVLDEALHPDTIAAVNIGVAGMNLFTIAYAVLLAQDRGLTIGKGVDVEMLAGMAEPQSRAVAESLGPLLYYVPVVKPEEYTVAVAYLVRRLEENAAPQNFMSHVFSLDDDAVFALEADRFRSAVRRKDSGGIRERPNRTQDRRQPPTAWNGEEFENTPDTDPSLAANIVWAEEIAARIPGSRLGIDTANSFTIASKEAVDGTVARVRCAAGEWGSRSGAERGAVLRAVAHGLEARRGDLIEVAGSEAGKTFDQADSEVSEAADFARYYAGLAEELDELRGANFHPVETTAVIPPWNFPVAIPAGGVLASLAAGSGVLFKPASLSRRTGAVLAEIMWDAGVPRDLLACIDLERSMSRELGEHLVRSADQVILTGSIDTACMFRSWRPDLRLFAETSGKNAIIVTPHADIDAAVRDVVSSAFGHAGQKCSAASLVILVGSVGFSRRFQRQLVDAIHSLRVGPPEDLATQMGPLIEPPREKLMRGLTTLGPGEKWVLTPQKLGERLWSPGVRVDVQPGSEYHMTEYFGPVLGIMRAKTLDEAIEWQNATEFGLTTGLHSLDRSEINFWLESVEAGNLYVNRGITGAIVRRQPFGGWKRSSVGTGTKAGGPHYVVGLGHVSPDFSEPLPLHVHITHDYLREARSIAGTMTVVDQDKFLRVIRGMDRAITEEFGQYHDPSAFIHEKNVFRYVPAVNTVIRLCRNHQLGELLAVAAGALEVGAHARISTAIPISKPMAEFFAAHGLDVSVENDADFAAHLAHYTDVRDGVRVRLLGDTRVALAEAVQGSVDIAIFDEPVTACGRLELLPFVVEQSISATNHRFGHPTRLLEGLL